MMSKKKKLSCFIIAFILSLSSVVADAGALTEEEEEVVLTQQEEENNDMIISGGREEDDDTSSSHDHEEEQHSSSSSIIIDTTAAAVADQQQENNVKELPPITTVDSASAAHEPPSHFQISAHVQTNLHTGLSYFLPLHDDDDNNQSSPSSSSSSSSSFAHIPFLECGAIGSTTATVPLVSGVFRHSPVMMISDTNSEKEKLKRGGLEFLEEITSLDDDSEDEESSIIQDALLDDSGDGTDSSDIQKDTNGMMKRPSPPTYVVALSPLEITVGGNGNETQHFNAGDVIFFEDTWLGIWDNISEDYDDGTTNKENLKSEGKVKGYTMRASSESREDMNVIMLTIPPALHRQWKHRHERQRQQERSNNNKKDMVHDQVVSNKSQKTTTTPPWWKLSSRIIQKQQITDELPKPCTLESDPAFAHPSVSVPTTLSQHFSQHFTNLLRRFHQPFHLSLSSSSSSNDTYDVILPIFAQTAAATIGGATALAGVLHLLRTVNPTVAIGFGAACVIGFGTWGIVWLGDEMLDEWEMWRERRRLERRMSESWDIQ